MRPPGGHVQAVVELRVIEELAERALAGGDLVRDVVKLVAQGAEVRDDVVRVEHDFFDVGLFVGLHLAAVRDHGLAGAAARNIDVPFTQQALALRRSFRVGANLVLVFDRDSHVNFHGALGVLER